MNTSRRKLALVNLIISIASATLGTVLAIVIREIPSPVLFALLLVGTFVAVSIAQVGHE